MKQILFFALALLMLCSCARKPADPIAEAIVAELLKNIDRPCQITVDDLRKLDSTTFATEFKRRIGIYEIRLDQNTARMEKYIREGKSNNATKVFQELQRDTRIFNELNRMKELMGDDTLKIAYYDYACMYGGKIDGRRIPSRQCP